jgi:hypothetical protein
MPNELAVPPNVTADSKACELIRAWAAHGGLICSLNPVAWPKDEAPIAWGILLSDVARHVANALDQAYGLDQATVLARMRTVFDSELDSPTANAHGKVV